MIESTDLAYAAGYTDGDGCFHLGKVHTENRIRYRALFVINSTEIENVQWFQQIFRGTISSKKRRKSNHKIIYRYVLKGKELDRLRKIRPFLHEKEKEFDHFFYFIDKVFSLDDCIKDLKNIKENGFLVNEIGNLLKGSKKQIIPSIEDLAYLAGFIDAECCLNIQKSYPKNRPNPTYKIQLQCNNSKWPTFAWISKRFGGQFHYIDRSKYLNNRDQITWRISSKELYPILEGILPFLKHKKPVCEEMIKFYKTTFKRSGQPSPNSPRFTEFYRPILEEREIIFHKIQSLNKKGI